MPSRHSEALPSDNEFGAAALHMSVLDIDRFLTAGDSSASRIALWVPESVSSRDLISGRPGDMRDSRASHMHHKPSEFQPSHGIESEFVRMHAAPAVASLSDRRWGFCASKVLPYLCVLFLHD